MEIYAKDVMITDVETIRDDAPIIEAVDRILHGKIRDTGHKTVSLMVIDEFRKLEGVISLFDILYHFRPDFLNWGLDAVEKWSGRLMPLLDQFKELTVEQVMSSPVMTVSPDDHLMVIIDTLVKKKLRRLPVVENDKLVGVVYLYDAFYHLFSKWCDMECGR